MPRIALKKTMTNEFVRCLPIPRRGSGVSEVAKLLTSNDDEACSGAESDENVSLARNGFEKNLHRIR